MNKTNNLAARIGRKHYVSTLMYVITGSVILSLIFCGGYSAKGQESVIIDDVIPFPIADSCYLGDEVMPCTYLCPANCPEPRATGAFLKVDGINGESKHDHHIDEIELLTWSWGMNKKGKSTKRGSGKTESKEMVVTKYFDIASPKIMKALADKTKIGEAILKVHADTGSANGNGQLDYIVITMTDVVITSYEVTHDEGNRPTEKVTLEFAKVKVEYAQPDDPENSEEFGWDFKKNKAE